jgi:glyoxylase-like metal-dependent hydrolase (beta-lactamase superfamily II)
MKLGDLEFWLMTDGTFRLDGGAMFGVIPKPMWERVAPADARNRILMAMNSLLIRAAGKWILVETGAGDKWDAKRTDIYSFDAPPRLPEKLIARGVAPEKIDIVINTHLHFDHCGWNTRMVNGEAVPAFPNAQYFVQQGELEHAKDPSDRDRASYFPENFVPMEKSGQWRLVQGDAELIPGIELLRAPGHNRDMVCVRLRGGGKTVFFSADLIPTAAHLPYPWIMGYDLYPLTTLENKKKWISQAAREGWLVIFGHEPATPAGYLREQGGKYILEPVSLDS